VDDREEQPGTRQSLRVAVSGAGGLIGSALVRAMVAEGHEIRRLVRRPSADRTEVSWDPTAGTVDAEGLEGLDAVVHLAGENIASGRWTAARKETIRASRVGGTRSLCDALARLEAPPGVIVSASAIGYYGDRGEELLDETSPPGKGFFPGVGQAWEAATSGAEKAGIRVVKLRIGVVLSGSGGALARMLPPFRLGLGGRLGSGRQYMSWIALDDLVAAIRFAIDTPSLRGPVNATAPEAVTNADFTRTLGRVLGRPTPFPIPGPALRVLAGGMADEALLSSARVRPRRLQESGFRFLHPDLDGALRFELGRQAGAL
jgi:uncharacterized protein (TIGR01777 family)